MKIVLIILGLLDFSLLIFTISLWRSSRFPGAEIGNMDAGLAKITFGVFLFIALIIIGIVYSRK